MGNIKKFKMNLEQKILESNSVIVMPHTGIDFDAIGSSLGISLIAKELNRQSCIIVDDSVYKIDYGVKLILDEAKKDFEIINGEKYYQKMTDNDLFVLSDVNKSNLITLSEELEKNRTVIIDHHAEGEKTIDAIEKYIDPTVSSASEIVTKLLYLFKIKPCPEIANYLLAGIYLDTNKLSKNVSSETMKTVAKLLQLGAQMNKVTDLFAEDFLSDRRVQDLVSKANMYTYSLATVIADENIKYTKEELAKAADYLLKYKVDAAFVIGNLEDGDIAISARSKEKVNVGDVMSYLEGGGNSYSAATRLKDCTVEEASKKLMKVIQPSFYIPEIKK